MKKETRLLAGIVIVGTLVAMFYWNPNMETFIGYYVRQYNPPKVFTFVPKQTHNYYLFSTFEYTGFHKTSSYVGVLNHIFQISGSSIKDIDYEMIEEDSFVHSINSFLPNDTLKK